MEANITLTIGGQTKRSSKGQVAVIVPWNDLTDDAQAFAIRYGLKQYLADAGASASDADDFKARVEQRLAKLIAGDLSRTKGDIGDREDSLATRTMKLARQAVRDLAKDKNVKLDKEQVAEAAKAWTEADDQFAKEAERQLAAEKTAREGAGKSAVKADVMALLGIKV